MTITHIPTAATGPARNTRALAELANTVAMCGWFVAVAHDPTGGHVAARLQCCADAVEYQLSLRPGHDVEVNARAGDTNPSGRARLRRRRGAGADADRQPPTRHSRSGPGGHSMSRRRSARKSNKGTWGACCWCGRRIQCRGGRKVEPRGLDGQPIHPECRRETASGEAGE